VPGVTGFGKQKTHLPGWLSFVMADHSPETVGKYPGSNRERQKANVSPPSSHGRQGQLGFANLAAALWAHRHLPTNPVIYLFANVISGEAVALLDLALEPITPPVDDI
jgi:hypothetical protein